uniref:Cytochrome P450 n=1 Tax=Arcella intermedia TaxID=1963864 RepID=A0A6B2L684_9EUKA
MGQGLVTSEGKVWREDRKLLTPFFHFKAVQEAFPISIEAAQYLLQTIGVTNEWLPAKDTFATYSSKVIIKFAFGDSFDVKVINTQIKEILQTFNDYFIGKALLGDIWDYIPVKSGRGMTKLTNKFVNSIKGTIIQKRESKTEAKDLLSFLCQLRYEDGSMMSEKHVIDHCTTFLFAGEDTTACTLSWVMYYISLYPDIQERLQDEVDEVLKGSLPTMETIHQLHLCNNVIKETLRIQPVVPYISRIANRDYEFSGVTVKKGTCVSFGIYPLHHDTTYWEKPDEFIPERWDEDSCKKSFLWVPFSAGQRNCLGQKFALQEIIIVLAMIIQQYRVHHNQNKNVIPVWEGVLTPVGLELKFVPRHRRD